MKTEIWNGHEIRFVERVPGEWWAVLADVASALDLYNRKLAQRLDKDALSKCPLETNGGKQEMTIVNEFGLYDAIFSSKKPEAKQFKRWVFEIIATLRKETGLEGFQVFRMMDIQHQKDAMKRLKDGLNEPKRQDFIKANVIANKAVSNIYGHPKMLKKEQMTPNMLKQREPILDDTVNLIAANESFDLGISVSEKVYKKYAAN